jgi:predicted nucleic acid-binding protein
MGQAFKHAEDDPDPIRYSHAPFLGHTWELKENLTVYYAGCVVNGEALDAPLITLDERLAKPRATAERWS